MHFYLFTCRDVINALLLATNTDISKRTYSQILWKHCSSGLQAAGGKKKKKGKKQLLLHNSHSNLDQTTAEIGNSQHSLIYLNSIFLHKL